MSTKRKTTAQVYRCVSPVSVRRSNQRDTPGWDEFIEWLPGDLLSDWPAWADVAGWLASGHIEEVGDV